MAGNAEIVDLLSTKPRARAPLKITLTSLPNTMYSATLVFSSYLDIWQVLDGGGYTLYIQQRTWKQHRTSKCRFRILRRRIDQRYFRKQLKYISNFANLNKGPYSLRPATTSPCKHYTISHPSSLRTFSLPLQSSY